MLRPLHQILTTNDLAVLQAAGLPISDEIEEIKEQQERAEREDNWDMLITQKATELAAYQNDLVNNARQLRRDIISYGGVSKSDYEIPGKYKRKDGQPLDCIAQEMGYANDSALALDIDAAENKLRQLPIVNNKRVQLYRIKDFKQTAEADLIEEHGRTWEDDTNEECPF